MITKLDSASVAQYLTENPNFFAEQSALLGKVLLSSPLTGRAISLQERQMELMREKYKSLESRIDELMRTGQENDAITRKLHAWTRSLLLARNDIDLPHTLVQGLQAIFAVPQATLRIWNTAAEFSQTWFVRDVSEDARLFAASLKAPYCGSNHDFEAVRWLADASSVQSTAILPLRSVQSGPTGCAFGLLILGSADPERYTERMATDFLVNIADTTSAALSCLLEFGEGWLSA